MAISILYSLVLMMAFPAAQVGKAGADLSGYKLIALDVTGTTAFPHGVLMSDFPIRVGEKAIWTRINEGLKRIRRRFEEAGYIDFKYTPLIDMDRQAKTLSCSFDLVQGTQYRINAIAFIGNTLLRDADMQSALTGLELEEGKIFRPSRLDDAIKALNKLLGSEQLTAKDYEIKRRYDIPGAVDVNIKMR
jgi:outer membrane protein assembly factor BamA